MIHPVVLCGGSGTRLWPLSRKSYPKQFVKFDGEDTLFKNTIKRVFDLPDTSSPIVICNDLHKYYAKANLEEINQEALIVVEPEPKNTAPAITAAAFLALEDDPEALLLVLPADHKISPEISFKQAVTEAKSIVENDFLVTFGIKPSSPETGYGYICLGEKLGENSFKVASFTEKPSLEIAKDFLSSGNYFWNSGIFFFKAKLFLEEIKRFSPHIFEAVEASVKNKQESHFFTKLQHESFKEAPSDSIDYAVMEKTDKAAVIPLELSWNDMGTWNSFYDEGKKDSSGNVIKGDVLCENTVNCYIQSTGRLIATLGIKDLTVIETKDAVLIATLAKSQDIKFLVKQLELMKRPEIIQNPLVYRPWGNYESLATGDRFQVKRIIVEPGQQLSLQMHHHRAEHWIIVQGTALVQIGEEKKLLTENQSTYIPLGKIHRLINPGKVPLILIEVQSGSYLGEDDIVRYEDIYDRT